MCHIAFCSISLVVKSASVMLLLRCLFTHGSQFSACCLVPGDWGPAHKCKQVERVRAHGLHRRADHTALCRASGCYASGLKQAKIRLSYTALS